MNTFANDAPSYFLIFVARFVFLNNSENCCKPIEFYLFIGLMKWDTAGFDCISVATSLENEITVMNGNLYFVVLAESV